jgi:hypothetical protein
MASQIGMTVNAITNDQSAFGTAATFTIQSGTTSRIFITRTGHPSVNSTSIPTANFITGTTNFEHGHIRIDPIATSTTTAVERPGDSQNVYAGGGFRDATMLSFWGAVVVEQNTTGFAMEFIGDMHDSAATPSFDSAEGNAVSGPAAP